MQMNNSLTVYVMKWHISAKSNDENFKNAQIWLIVHWLSPFNGKKFPLIWVLFSDSIWVKTSYDVNLACHSRLVWRSGQKNVVNF